MVYEHYDREIANLIKRVEELEQEIDSLKKEINNKTIENNLYNTSSTISQNTVDIDMDRDYGQQSF
jgi:cell division septum initiation protein DivIVA